MVVRTMASRAFWCLDLNGKDFIIQRIAFLVSKPSAALGICQYAVIVVVHTLLNKPDRTYKKCIQCYVYCQTTDVYGSATILQVLVIS